MPGPLPFLSQNSAKQAKEPKSSWALLSTQQFMVTDVKDRRINENSWSGEKFHSQAKERKVYLNV